MEKEKKVRTVLYCRVAAEGQAEALEAQKKNLRTYAKQKGYVIVAEILEVAKGLTLDRAGIQELNKLASDRAMDEILTMDMSRIGRHAEDIFTFETTMEQQNICLNTLKGNSLPSIRSTSGNSNRGPQ